MKHGELVILVWVALLFTQTTHIFTDYLSLNSNIKLDLIKWQCTARHAGIHASLGCSEFEVSLDKLERFYLNQKEMKQLETFSWASY